MYAPSGVSFDLASWERSISDMLWLFMSVYNKEEEGEEGTDRPFVSLFVERRSLAKGEGIVGICLLFVARKCAESSSGAVRTSEMMGSVVLMYGSGF